MAFLNTWPEFGCDQLLCHNWLDSAKLIDHFYLAKAAAILIPQTFIVSHYER
jgi:hypothetical protein